MECLLSGSQKGLNRIRFESSSYLDSTSAYTKASGVTGKRLYPLVRGAKDGLYDEALYTRRAPLFRMKAFELTPDVREAMRTELGLMFSQAPAVMQLGA